MNSSPFIGPSDPIFDPENVAKMKKAMFDSIYRALDSGAQEYRVGSRSLKRYSLKEQQDMINFLDRLAQPDDAGRSGRMFARRIMPTDN